MSNTLNRDKLRGIVSDLQKLTGRRITPTRFLMSKQDCYKAIYDLMKLELNIDTKNENETLKRLNKTLNEVNCEVNQEREELRKEVEKLEKENKELKNGVFVQSVMELDAKLLSENEFLKKENEKLEGRLKGFHSDAKEVSCRKDAELHSQIYENKKLKTKNKVLTVSWWIMLISLMTSVGVNVCKLF